MHILFDYRYITVSFSNTFELTVMEFLIYCRPPRRAHKIAIASLKENTSLPQQVVKHTILIAIFTIKIIHYAHFISSKLH